MKNCEEKVKVITYGTYDVLHHGHIRLLERAKALGDYLIVGVTSDDYDKSRGKINNQQTIMERVDAIKATGIADEVIIEEYDGQKIDDIRKYGIDIFTVGSDWEGKFDYLNEYCKVVYLPRTQGVSSTEIRAKQRQIKIGVVGENNVAKKFIRESKFANGCQVSAVCTEDSGFFEEFDLELNTKNYEELLDAVDAVYVISHPTMHYEHIKQAILHHKHVICESPIALTKAECEELFSIAKMEHVVLADGIKTAYATAYERLLLLVKSGIIGDVVSIDATCTSLKDLNKSNTDFLKKKWNSICSWGPTAMLPIFQILGTNYLSKHTISAFIDDEKKFDFFTKINFVYENAIASIKIGKGVKSEGDLVISGTKGYIYVPSPWWKTDYYEIRFENIEENKRGFYQLNGEGIRYEIVSFVREIESLISSSNISRDVSVAISKVIEDFNNRIDFIEICKTYE
jgi:choline-phosphate cytidylyltransferase